jgi:ribosomal protein L4
MMKNRVRNFPGEKSGINLPTRLISPYRRIAFLFQTILAANKNHMIGISNNPQRNIGYAN